MTGKPLIFDFSEKKESFQNQVRNLCYKPQSQTYGPWNGWRDWT